MVMTMDTKTPERQMPAGEFKAQCLRLMDRVNASGEAITITKRGRPVARLVPCETRAASLVGALKGRVTVLGDIVSALGEDWQAAWHDAQPGRRPRR